MISEPFSNQTVELSGFDVNLDLLIPKTSIAIKEPGSKLGEIFQGESLESLFELLDFSHASPSLSSPRRISRFWRMRAVIPQIWRLPTW